MFTIISMLVAVICAIFAVVFVRLLINSTPIERRRGSLIVLVPTALFALLGFALGSACCGAEVGFSLGAAFLHFLKYGKFGPM